MNRGVLKISNRKGQIAKWLACFAGLALAVVSLVALNSASAAESPFEIVDAKITASSEGVISEISDFDETKITTSATFHKKDENIKYLVTIKNTSDKDYTIKNISDDNKNAYIAYSYDTHSDETIKGGESLALEVVATYKTLITDISERHQKFVLSFTVEYEGDVAVPNTGANSISDGAKNIVPIVAIVVGVGVVMFVLAKSDKIKAPVKVAGVVLIGSVAISSVANALAPQFVFKFDNDFELKSLLEVKYTVRTQTGTVIVPYGETLPIDDPEITGYSFDGWQTPAGEDVPETMPIVDDMEIIAQLTPIEYEITYDLGDGTVAEANPRTYTIEDTFTLHNPTLDNYEFSGWSGTGLSGEGNTEVTVPVGETGPRAYVAHYEEICPQGYICYYANGGNGTMNNQSASAGGEAILQSTNFDRSGYGFKGWNTKRDGTGTLYGPNETIVMPESGVLKLYADWLASTGTIQNYNCANLASGSVVALTDNRDNQAYAVAKLADGNCWMIESMRLSLDNLLVPMSAENTNNPASAFATAVNEQHPASSAKFYNWCLTSDAECVEQIQYDSRNVSRIGADGDPSDPSPGSDYNYWGVKDARYGYGTYYNWYTATAGNGTFETETGAVAGDICPAGWHLPTGGSAGEMNGLFSAVGSPANVRKHPNNFVFGGYRYGTTVYNRYANFGHNWLSTASGEADDQTHGGYKADFSLVIYYGVAATSTESKYYGYAVRCLAD